MFIKSLALISLSIFSFSSLAGFALDTKGLSKEEIAKAKSYISGTYRALPSDMAKKLDTVKTKIKFEKLNNHDISRPLCNGVVPADISEEVKKNGQMLAKYSKLSCITLCVMVMPAVTVTSHLLCGTYWYTFTRMSNYIQIRNLLL